MAFIPNKSKTEADEREEKSVDFIRALLAGYGVKTELKKGDKGANIDGYIELLDSEYRINGKITAQVKTVSPSDEGKFTYDCPTSLFGYASRTTEIVLLMAVDHRHQTVLWKYISRDLIEANASKEHQKTISLSFSDEERMTSGNVQETIDRWHKIFGRQLKLYNRAPILERENERLRQELLQAKGIDITLPAEELQKVHSFIDAYNSLMDRELKYIKQTLYPNTWKYGIAIYRYEPTELGYYIYSVHKNESTTLVKQLPPDFPHHLMDFDVMTNFYKDNPIMKDYRQLVRRCIKDHIDKFVSHDIELPKSVPYAMETVNTYFEQDKGGVVVPLKERVDFKQTVAWMESNIDYLLKQHTEVIYGFHQSTDMYAVYHSMRYLLSEGVDHLISLYPPKGGYGNTGMIYDWYNVDTAYEKVKHVLPAVGSVYWDFVNSHFPSLTKELDYYSGSNVIVYSIEYGDRHGINTYWFSSKKEGDSRNFYFCKNGDSPILKQLFAQDGNWFKTTFTVGDKDYLLQTYSQSVAYETLFSNEPLRDTLRKLIKSTFEQLADKLVIPE